MDDQLKRLEAVTTRLESFASRISSAGGASGQSHVNGDSANNVDSLPILRDYDTLINESVKPFLVISQKIGGDLTTMSDHVGRLFNAQQQFLRQAVQSKKPNDQQLMEVIKPQSSEIEAITDFTNKNRKSPLFNHLSAISEGIPALGWILVAPTPGPHIKDMTDAAQFYSNRVLKEFKDKDTTHTEWVKSWTKALNDLYTYVRQHHTTGLAWASQGKRDFGSISVTTAKPVAGGPPPPPPPPPPPSPPPPMLSDTTLSALVDNSHNELMSSINALGQGATSRLKKVPDELKTHKNPQLRQSADDHSGSHEDVAHGKKGVTQLIDGKPVVPPKPGKPASSPVPIKSQTVNTPKSTATTGPPKLALEGSKWVVEYQTGKHDLRITETNMKHCIYIYKCTNSTITVEGKVNSIVLDQCTKVGLQFTSVVSLIEFINCKSMKAQVIERVPTVQIEKTDGCHIYLSDRSLDTEFITSKSSEMSVNIPFGDGEFKEYPIAEQFKTYFHGKQLVTVPNESSGV